MSVKEYFIRIFPFVRNKFTFTAIIFVIWVGFFDQYNIVERIKNNRKLRELEIEKEHYVSDIETTKRKLKELKGDKEMLEKFAREQYLMKKKNEDIYLVVED